MIKLLLVMLFFMSTVFGYSDDNSSDILKPKRLLGLDFKFSISLYSILANEYVYDESFQKKISQLTWRADNIALLGIGFSYQLQYGFTLHLDYQKNITADDAIMDDYDWLLVGIADWSDWSHHDNTFLTDITKVNIFLMSPRYYECLSFGLGYKYDLNSWKAYDGTYIYSSDPGFRDQGGTFSGLMVSYTQEYESMYLRLSLSQKIKQFILSTSVDYSPFVRAYDYDTHHIRNVQFDSSFDNMQSITCRMSVRYDLPNRFFLFFDYEKQIFSEGAGSTHYHNLTSNYETDYLGAGIDSSSELFMISIGMIF